MGELDRIKDRSAAASLSLDRHTVKQGLNPTGSIVRGQSMAKMLMLENDALSENTATC